MSESNKRYISESVKHMIVEVHDKLVEEEKSVPEQIQAVYECVTSNEKTCSQGTLTGAMTELKDAGYFKLPGDDTKEELQKQLREQQ